MEKLIPTVQEVRRIIENIEEEKLRHALMYQFLMGAEIGELCGDYAPDKNNCHEIEMKIGDEKYPALLFMINNIKPKQRGLYRSCIIPLDSDFEPWSRNILEWYKMHDNKYPFDYGERNYSRLISNMFKGYKWPKDPYGKSKIQYNDFRSADLRKLRIKNLKEFYDFTPIDLARFGAWNENPKEPRLRLDIKKILSTQDKEKDIDKMITNSITYFEKLMKPIELIGKVTPLYPLQIRNYADLNERFEISKEIVDEVKSINFLCRKKIGEYFEFFKENMWLPIEVFNPCGRKDNAQFLSKIASLAALFEVNIEPLEYLKKSPDDKSIVLTKYLLNKKKIKYNDDMFNTWFNIRKLRSKIYPIHSETELIIMDILEYFGEPQKWPPDYNSLWDNILSKFKISLLEWHDILNKM